MIQSGTLLNVCDNSGAKLVKCIKILGSSKKRYAYLGDILKISIKKVFFNSKLKRGEIYNSILIRSLYNFRRFDGSFISFNSNSVVLLNDKYDFISTRIFGPVVKELKKNKFFLKKINNLSPNYI
ncbi:50S ribosomal subunit protein L14 [Candidatus Nasuia deltocephalinicola]|uniref:Large ribosomal subunit protein uL14 n=1 Tax=Candidatus Nasuia deltocephalincola TaxID=1160784 RepID=A0A974WKL1_9PROT|nr:50S ribosomal protein L14 [Candidatus Nasuia deltocephalinicola]BEH03940.1 50S ribosomal subunit protein L14 [Candidatus Nasuia deltocephalinicola]